MTNMTGVHGNGTLFVFKTNMAKSVVCLEDEHEKRQRKCSYLIYFNIQNLIRYLYAPKYIGNSEKFHGYLSSWFSKTNAVGRIASMELLRIPPIYFCSYKYH